MKSKLGLMLSGIYVLISAVCTYSQGLFGESFIALILGLPWSLIFAFFEYGNVTGVLLYVFILAPIVLNAVLLYLIGSYFGRRSETHPDILVQ